MSDVKFDCVSKGSSGGWWSVADVQVSRSAVNINRKKGFHSISPYVFGPRLKGLSVPVHLKMWVRGH
jgi:hypothetical protein